MKLYKNTAQLFLLLFFSATVFSQTAKYSNEFLAIGVGARALSMSGASVASVNDVTSGYWNPAGLLFQKSNIQIGLMHSEYFAGIAKYDYGAFSARIDSSSVLGVSLVRFGVDDIPNTTQLIDANGNVDYDKITTFSAADYGFLVSYAKRTKIPGLRLGGNVKIIKRKVGDFGGAIGFGIDAAAQYDYKQWKLAAVLRDATSTFNAWHYTLDDKTKAVFQQTGNIIPENSVEVTLPRLILGAGRRFDFKQKYSLLVEMDLLTTFDKKRNVLLKSNLASVDPKLGIEAGYKDFIFLRAGIGNFQQFTDVVGKKVTSVQPSVGVGVKIKNITIDYALTSNTALPLYSNIFSLKLDINRRSRN